jgi:hypothetical protein
VLSTGNQSLDGAGSLAAEQPVGVLPLGELNHRSLEATGQQLGLQLLNQAFRGGLPCAVAIEGDQEVFHPLALQKLQLQRRHARAQTSDGIREPRLVELDHIQRSLHQ